ncbi:hypothetical protein GCM10017786_21180 [Amycolatopsis deserti]|uniref:Uncharacterized protein n=1 Tax=Amycolatopsis deserti TaxID=185696 RepID=A0ABQ3IQ34_9PSEU|nr:hypothetical protein [Amycolatopsis deserti]GHE88920.1 hypothetical protein GCM10017786_21180 [Amycolatopsis deserti]
MSSPTRWQMMRDAITSARRKPDVVIKTLSECASRPDAAATLATLLDVDPDIADQILDLRLSDFIPQHD